MRRGFCSTCGEAFTEKPATVFVAWRDQGEERQAWRMQWCRKCTYGHLNATFEKVLGNPSYAHCLAGGESLNGSGGSLVWLTIFLPKQEREDAEWWYCADCVVDVRNALTDGGIRQPNRPGFDQTGGRDQETPWPALGQAQTVAQAIKRGRRS
ncbi:MAG: hypothetical protein HRJ53_07790 [Acidobacteria bacterium Pan2503]|uniref:Uncharacterized protein n=1 Tax=Candidatus Acidiferrum panamense TaxID=2741543 RepID=A0A7V8NP38_9BACT|nr:hypothetical protein [Candidatus Acidoferrum panamensis]